MKKLAISIGLALGLAGAANANAASEWGIDHEEKSRMEVKVVDILCELTGDCPDNCGAGNRQLGLVTNEGVLIPAVKNFEIWAGTATDLVAHCNKKVIVDGLYIKDPLMPMFALQFSKTPEEGSKWERANKFGKKWLADNPDKKVKAHQWYKHDDRVKKIIDEQGVLGIPGLEYKEE